MSRSILSRQDNSGEQLLKLFANPFQSQIQINGFWAALGLSLGLSAALTLLFSLLRPQHNLVYAPRSKYADSTHVLPPVGKGIFGWVKPTWSAKEDLLLEKLGPDATLFLRFTRMLRNIFCILAIIGVAIMIPVNVTTGVKGIQDKSNVFAIMTPLYTWGTGLYAQVVVAYAIDLVVLYFIWHNYRRVVSIKRHWYNSPEYQGSLSSRSVLLRHIPAKMRSEEGILRITDEVNPTGSIPIPIAIRNVKDIPELIEKHEEMVRKLESILAKYLKNPERLPSRKPMMTPPKTYKGPSTGGKVDAIDYYRRQIEVLEQNINGMRSQINNQDIMAYGFATWEHIDQAHAVARAARKKSPHGTKVRQAPRPHDIIWQNMDLTKSQLRRKSIMNGIWITLLTVVWTPLNAGMAVFLSNLSNLGSLWPTFQTELNRNKTFWSIVQGIAAPAITSAVYLLLPIIFRRLQIRAGDVTKTARERHVLRNLFNFFILNNLLIFSLFSAIWQYVTTVINDSGDDGVWNALQKGDFFLTVTTQLCQSISPFWVTWILQRNLGAAIDLAQLWTLFYQWFAKTFMSPTPRQYIEWTAPAQFQYASYYNYFLFYTAVSLCFATLQPIILVCTALYFVIDSVLKKYLLMYVFVTKTESGAELWRTLINRLIFSCILADVIIGIVVKARGTWGMAIALVPLLVIMIGFKFYCMKTFDPQIDYYSTDAERIERSGMEPNAKLVHRAAAKFRHPVIDKKLMTPMVPAKAKHIVAQIYSGRLDSQIESGPPAFSDIPLQPIKQGAEPPQHQAFEAVPEAQLDYAYYKNRSDFGNVGGDRLSRYDMINSRPGTPGSFPGSRTQSPSPYGVKSHQPYTDSRSSSPVSGIARKEIGSSSVHPALRAGHGHSRYSSLAQVESHDEPDIGMHPQPYQPTHQHQYSDPNDDRANLLRDVGPGLRTPDGEFMSVDQFRTPYTAGDQQPQGGSYDYFRRHGDLK